MKPVAVVAALALGCAPVHAQSKASTTPQEQAILKFVLDWWREGFVARHPEMVKKYFADNFIQHNPNLAGGTAAIEKMVSRPAAARDPGYLAEVGNAGAGHVSRRHCDW